MEMFDFTGVDLKTIQLPEGGVFKSSKLYRFCDLNGANKISSHSFDGVDLGGIKLPINNHSFDGVDLGGIKLPINNHSFDGVDLSGIKLPEEHE